MNRKLRYGIFRLTNILDCIHRVKRRHNHMLHTVGQLYMCLDPNSQYSLYRIARCVPVKEIIKVRSKKIKEKLLSMLEGSQSP